ncbi:MAG: IPT/TIG domain-containing protein [Polyangiaceae bacterium]
MRSALGRIVAWVTCASAFTATAGCGVILDLGSLEKVDCVDCDDTGDGGEGGSVAGDGAVVTPDGGAPRSDSGAEAGAVPTLATVTPAAAFATDPAATLVVTGSGFEGSSVLLFDGTPVTTTFVDASTLRADVPASALTVPKKVALTVRGSGGTSSPLAFFVSDVVLNSVTPSTLATGSGTSTITLDGKGFASDTTFWFDDSKLASNLGNDRTASAILGSAMLATAGTHRISARGRAFDAGADFASSVTLKVETPTPVIQSIDPPSALVGDSTTLTIAGTGFIPASTVTIRGTAVPTTFVNASTLMATASGTVTAVPAVLDVTVVSPAPGGGTSAPKSLTIANPTPTISSISRRS